MKIIGIEHKVTLNQDMENYLKKVAGAISYSPDIVVGPDYGLSFLDKKGKIRFDLRDKIIKNLEEMSSTSPNTLLIPGTTPFLLGGDKMGHSAMIFRNGRKINEFRKETAVGDYEIATKNGLEYERGDSSRNKLVHHGKKITVEICSDHGKQIVDKDTFLEAILTYDDNAGFWIRPNNDSFSRYVLVVDGRAPKIEGFSFNCDTKKPTFLKEKIIGDLHIFELED